MSSMKTHSPLILGLVIFGANLVTQAVASGSANVDVYRAMAIAILCAMVYFIVLPLLGTQTTVVPRRIPVTRNLPEKERPSSRDD